MATKTLDFFSSVIPIFGTIGKAVSVPFTVANMYSDSVDRARAKSDFLVRASMGNQNLLQYLEISKLYSLEISRTMINETQIENPAMDANLAFQFFQGNMLLLGFSKKTWTQQGLVYNAAKKTVSDIIQYRKSSSWRARFKQDSIGFIGEGFEVANSEQIARMLDKVAALVASSQGKSD